MAAIPEDIYRELLDEFGEDADDVATRALRSEITRHRIATAVASGTEPARAVADALSRDPWFIDRTDHLAGEKHEPGSLEDRLRRWG